MRQVLLLDVIRTFRYCSSLEFCFLALLFSLREIRYVLISSCVTNDESSLTAAKLVFLVNSVALYLHFATSVIHEITTALGIYCFRWDMVVDWRIDIQNPRVAIILEICHPFCNGYSIKFFCPSIEVILTRPFWYLPLWIMNRITRKEA